MIGAALNWLENRTGLGKALRAVFFERLPGGPRWRYVWGSTVVFAIAIECITGLFLALTYSPGVTSAWESVYHIQNSLPAGAWLRGIHLWTAEIMVVLLLFHLVQMVIDGAYRAPRELNFWFALASMALVLAIARTGYLLPWDQEALSGTKVAMSYVDKAPLVATNQSMGQINAFRQLSWEGAIHPCVHWEDPGVAYAVSWNNSTDATPTPCFRRRPRFDPPVMKSLHSGWTISPNRSSQPA